MRDWVMNARPVIRTWFDVAWWKFLLWLTG